MSSSAPVWTLTCIGWAGSASPPTSTERSLGLTSGVPRSVYGHVEPHTGWRPRSAWRRRGRLVREHAAADRGTREHAVGAGARVRAWRSPDPPHPDYGQAPGSGRPRGRGRDRPARRRHPRRPRDDERGHRNGDGDGDRDRAGHGCRRRNDERRHGDHADDEHTRHQHTTTTPSTTTTPTGSGAVPTEATLRPGTTGSSSVVALQTALTTLGYEPGAADGPTARRPLPP